MWVGGMGLGIADQSGVISWRPHTTSAPHDGLCGESFQISRFVNIFLLPEQYLFYSTQISGEDETTCYFQRIFNMLGLFRGWHYMP